MRFILCKCIATHVYRCGRRGNLHYTAGLTYAVQEDDVRNLIVAKIMEPFDVLNVPGADIGELRALFDEVHAPPPEPEIEEPVGIGPSEYIIEPKIDAPVEGEPLAADDQ